MKAEGFFQDPHRRFNPLTREWVLVSPQRTERPWHGEVEATASPAALEYDPACYLCPGNQRAGGVRNPKYESTFVFTNDFAALKPEVRELSQDESGTGLTLAESEAGTCKVVCFSPRHDLTLACMPVADISKVVDVWTEQYRELGASPAIRYVQIFENRGETMGCSNPHPHCQIWANQTIPNEPRKEYESQKAYFESHRRCLLCDYLQVEGKSGERVIVENAHWMVLVPFWAVWPFEVMLLSKQHFGDLAWLEPATRLALAEILKQLTTRYDNLFEVSFPYSMGFHPSPSDGRAHPEWHLHAHFYPPLLRDCARSMRFTMQTKSGRVDS
jgi:UDPglucose--hexose-1-phosphate uridylyltransferase